MEKWGVLAQLLKNVNRFIYGCDIAFNIKIGFSFQLPHQGLGVVIGPKTIIGDDVMIFQHVTLGSTVNGKQYSAPIIANNVMIGAGASILGNVKIGNNVRIGANAVVLNDVPDNCNAVGAPARFKLMEDSE